MDTKSRARILLPRHIKRWFSLLKSRYYLNIITSLLLVSITVLCSFSIIIYNQFFNEYKRETVNKMKANVNSVESLLSQKLLDMKSMVFLISRNPAFTYYPYPQDTNSEVDMNIVRQLQNYVEGNLFYADIGFYRRSEPDTFYLSQGEFSKKELNNYIFSMEMDNDLDSAKFFNIYKGISLLQRTKGQEVYSFATGLDLGITTQHKIIHLFVYKKSIDDIVSSILNDIPYGFFIYDENNELLYSSGENSGVTEKIGGQLVYTDNRTPVIKEIGDKTYSFFHTTSAYNNWRYVASVDNDKLFYLYKQKLYDFYVLAALIAVLVIIVSGIFAALNYSPIRKLFGKVMNNFSNINREQLNEIQYIDRVVDHIVETRVLNRQKAVLSNLIWGQYDDRETAESDCEEAALQFPYDAYLVGVLQDTDKKHNENLAIVEQAFLQLDAICYSVGIHQKAMDAFIVNYDSKTVKEQGVAERFIKHIPLFHGNKITIGIGNAVDSLERLSHSFVQAKNAVKYRVDAASGQVVRYADIELDVHGLQVTGYKRNIVALIRRGDTDGALDKLNELLEMVYDHGVPYEKFKFVYYGIISAFEEVIIALDISGGQEFDRILAQILTDAKLSRQYVGGQLERMVEILCQQVNSSMPQQKDDQLLEKINQVILDRMCDHSMSLELLAEECNVSTSYLGRYFKMKTGYTPMHYVDIQKMEYAKKLLRETNDSLNEIVTKSGYIDASNFIRKFKSATGITPINYRKKYANTGE